MNRIDNEYLLGQLRWRYATKHFDPGRKISPADWATLEAALVLSPSSYGLQPWKFIVVSDPATRTRLRSAAHDQPQITDASHLVVFAIKTSLGEPEVDAHFACMCELRKISPDSLASYRARVVGAVARGMDETTRRAWESRQTYIALGILLASAAFLGIDACPMEGFQPAEFDAILGLSARNLASIVVCTLGHRSADDHYASLPKVRFREEDVFIRL